MSNETHAGDTHSRTDSGIESSETKTKVNVSDNGLLEQALGLTNFQVSLLAVAVGEPKSGQEILEVLNARPRDSQVTHGRLYPNLDTLVEKGLVEKNDRDRRTHEYPTTAKADQLFEAYGSWLERELVDPTSWTYQDEARRLSAELTHFQFAALTLLDGERISGQTVKDGLEGVYGCEINHGRLYPNLDTLVTNDLVEKGEFDRRTNYYEVVDGGKRVLAARWGWLRDQGAIGTNGGDA